MGSELPASEPERRGVPLISVVVATYNCADLLPACLDSILRQRYPHREVIVIDGGSRDGTVETIRSYAASIAHWESAPDKGVYDAWNKALALVKGDWICFLGADDRFHDESVLEKAVPFLEQCYPRSRFAYGCLNIVDVRGCIREVVKRPWPDIRDAFLAGTLMIPHTGSFHHRSLFQDYGTYDAAFRIAGDYDLLLRELRTADATYIAELTVVDMGDAGMSSSPGNMVLGLREIARARVKNGITKFSTGLAQRRLLAMAGALILRLFGRPAYNFFADTYRRLGRRQAKWSR